MNFDIRDHLDKLTLAKGKNFYHCPVCGSERFSINPQTGAFTCWANSCKGKDIITAIASSYKEKQGFARNQRYEAMGQAPISISLQGEGNEPKEIQSTSKSIRSKSRYEWIYTDAKGKPLIRVNRLNDGTTNQKQIWQEYFYNGSWSPKVPEDVKVEIQKAIAPYRYIEVQQAILDGKHVFFVEGETCADTLWNLNIPATTTIGGSQNYKNYGDYKTLMQGAIIVICPDMDKPGLKYAEQIEQDFPGSQWCYCFPDDLEWEAFSQNELKGFKFSGRDIWDWIEQGATAADILLAIQPRREVEKPNHGHQNSLTVRIELDVLAQQIREVLSLDQTVAELQLLKIDLRNRANVQEREFNQLWKVLEEEKELQETRDDRQQGVDKILQISRYELKLQDFLPLSLAMPLEKISGWISSTPGAILVTLLPIVASLCRVGTKLELIPETEFFALPILYTGIVAESGSAKSPTQKTILKPLFQLQGEAEEKYNQAYGEWQKQVKVAKNNGDDGNVQKPKPREYYTTDATREAVTMIQAQQPDHGFLQWFDELSAVINSQNAYRAGGKGADKEALLSGRDGSPSKINRASEKRLYVPLSAYSITGSTQPETLRNLMNRGGDNFADISGQWARFLWASIPIKPNPFPDNAVHLGISNLLYEIYRKIEQFPAITYRLSSDARLLYRDWFNELDQRRLIEPKPAFRAVYAKMKSDTGVLALLLYIIEAGVAKVSSPSQEIEASTMKAAIALSEYFIGQVKLVHSMGDEQAGDLSPVLAKIVEYSERKGWVSAREIKANIHSLKKINSESIREHFKDLVQMGYGSIRGSGNKIEWAIKGEAVDNVDASLSLSSTLEITAMQGIESSVDVVVEKMAQALDASPLHSSEYQERLDNQFLDFLDHFIDETPNGSARQQLDSAQPKAPEKPLFDAVDASSTNSPQLHLNESSEIPNAHALQHVVDEQSSNLNNDNQHQQYGQVKVGDFAKVEIDGNEMVVKVLALPEPGIHSIKVPKVQIVTEDDRDNGIRYLWDSPKLCPIEGD